MPHSKPTAFNLLLKASLAGFVGIVAPLFSINLAANSECVSEPGGNSPAAWHFSVNESGRFVRSDTGREQFLVTLETETDLWSSSLDELRRKDALGADGLYVSLWSGDDPGTHATPWIDPRDKSRGFDVTRSQQWHDRAEFWCSLDERNFIIRVFKEEEHFLQANDPYFSITWGQWIAYVEWHREWLEEFPGALLFCEESRFSDDVTAPHMLSLQESSIHPVAIHPPGHFYPWADSTGWELAPWVLSGAVDVFLFQRFNPDSAGFEMAYWHGKVRDAGLNIAVVAQELGYTGNGIPSDSAGGVDVGMRWLWNGYPWSAGVAIYSGYENDGCTDLDCPQPEVHSELLKHYRNSALAIEGDGYAPAVARILYDVPVPMNVADRNGDGTVDAGDLQ